MSTTKKSEKVSIDEISLLQFSDTFFPTGMYTMSNGLETYFYDKKIRTANQVRDLIKVFLIQHVGPTDCVALANSYQAILISDIQKLIEIDQIVNSNRTRNHRQNTLFTNPTFVPLQSHICLHLD